MSRYQISTDLSFDKQPDRDEVFTYLHGKKGLAMTDKGDFILMENVIDGSFRVACTFRLAKQTDSDEIETYLKDKKDTVRKDKLSHIEKHICEHDEGKSCYSQISDIWGEEVL